MAKEITPIRRKIRRPTREAVVKGLQDAALEMRRTQDDYETKIHVIDTEKPSTKDKKWLRKETTI